MEASSTNILLINLSLLVRVRILNVIMLILAMYISAFYLFDHTGLFWEKFKNIKLHGIVFSSALSAMAGYIINFFYDQDKDQIYRPISTMMQRFIQQSTALRIYLIFNFISLTITLFLSYRIFIFFLVYQFLIWLYSHKLSRLVFINNLTNSILMIFPFLALFLFYENYAPYILYLAVFLFLIILIRDIFKDFHSVKYDTLFQYHTLPNTLGFIPTKIILIFLLILLTWVSVHLTFEPHLVEIRLYYLLTALLCMGLIPGLWFSDRRLIQVLIIMIKFWIFLGTISLLFIDGNPLPLHFRG
ncbi:UbiA family prenyltransferase [Apibacter raozihei]|uniref:UbiA family prenyltransferase n=1 Tax=Apibacter TaxID=1778601 RepID=UPI000FE2BF85|nr:MULTISPECIES: UbiA family prenyltransferase [Apibacter]